MDEHTASEQAYKRGYEAGKPKWIPVTERLPDNEKTVLVLAERRMGAKKINISVLAFWTDGNTTADESAYDWDTDYVDMGYNEELDAYFVPAGWWESVRYGEEFCAVSDFVTHWCELPEPPKGE